MTDGTKERGMVRTVAELALANEPSPGGRDVRLVRDDGVLVEVQAGTYLPLFIDRATGIADPYIFVDRPPEVTFGDVTVVTDDADRPWASVETGTWGWTWRVQAGETPWDYAIVQYDDGRTKLTVDYGSGLTRSWATDGADAHDWSFRQVDRNADGTIAASVVVHDDDRVVWKNHAYRDGAWSNTVTTEYDVGDRHAWTAIHTEVFDGAHWHRTLFDDGRVVAVHYFEDRMVHHLDVAPEGTEGVVLRERRWDETGALVSKRAELDDGRVTETTHVDGRRSEQVTTDEGNAFAWTTQARRWDDTGAVVWERVERDDGSSVEVTISDDGLHRETVLTRADGSVRTTNRVEDGFGLAYEVVREDGALVRLSWLQRDLSGEYVETSARRFDPETGVMAPDWLFAWTETFRFEDVTIVTDDGDAPWATIETGTIVYDDGLGMQRRGYEIVTMDDGRTIQSGATPGDGGGSYTVETDPVDVAGWSVKMSDHGPDGTLGSTLVVRDDDRVVFTRYDEGFGSASVPITSSQFDVGDAYDWSHVEHRWNRDGDLFQRTTLMDDGRFFRVNFIDGVRTRETVEDYRDSFEWTRKATTFDGDGDLARRVVEQDDGLWIDKTFAAGRRVAQTVEDREDLYDWARIERTWDAEGTLVSTVRIMDEDATPFLV